MSVIVYIEEEFGYREWLWKPEMTREEIVSWWKAHASVNRYFYSGPKTFPGELQRIYIDFNDKYNSADVPFIFVKELNGELIQTSDQTSLTEYYKSERKNNLIWYMHLHTDGDSYLKTPEGEFIFHKGKISEDEYYSGEYQPSQEAEADANLAMREHVGKVVEQIREEDSDGDNSNNRKSDKYN